MKILKYSCFPIYLISLPRGRLRHFFDYVSLFIMIGCMFLITNSASYFSYVMSYNLTIVGIVTAILLCYPTISYYTQLSKKDHYDFLNIFIQAGIFKLFTASLILSISSCNYLVIFSYKWISGIRWHKPFSNSNFSSTYLSCFSYLYMHKTL